MLDENLTWKSHIEMVGKKISKVTGILYRLKNILPENVLFVLYISLIVSYINYGLLLFQKPWVIFKINCIYKEKIWLEFTFINLNFYKKSFAFYD